MKKAIILTITFLTFQLGSAQETAEFFTKSDVFFKKYVAQGKVAYTAIKNNPSLLNELLDMASAIKVSKSSPKTFQAFYINAYNLAVIKGVIANYPIKSPLDVKGFFDTKTYLISGKKTTLNGIENEILRKNFPNEARFHFVLVCAGLGCPPIINSAYTPDKLSGQLQRQTVKSLNNPNFIKVSGSEVKLSQIFEWYKGDFTKKGSEIAYINTYRKEKIPTSLKVSYYPYDWKLNISK